MTKEQWLKWFEEKWEEFESTTLKQFIETMNTGSILQSEKASFLMRIAQRIGIEAKDVCIPHVIWKEVLEKEALEEALGKK